MEKIEYDFVSPLAPYMRAYLAEYESQGRIPNWLSSHFEPLINTS